MSFEIGKTYKDKDGNYFKPIQFLPKNSEQNKNAKTSAQIVKVEYTTGVDSVFGLIKYFKLSKLKEMEQS